MIKKFLKLFRPTPVEVIPIKTQQIKESDLQSFLKNKKSQHLANETLFLKPIKKRISVFESSISKKIEIFDGIDLEKRKIEQRIKSIITGNIGNYTNHLQKMIDKLNDINKRKEIIQEINKIFTNFNEKTNITSQKIAYLFPKEIVAVKNEMAIFLKDLEKIFKADKEDFEEYIIIEAVEKIIPNYNIAKEQKESALEILNKDNKLLEKLKKELVVHKNKIKKIEESREFKLELEKRHDLESKKKNLEKGIYGLKGLIDFKGLAFFYHAFEKEMKLIKEYKEDFSRQFHSRNIENLTNLLEGASLNNDKISKLIEKLKQEEKEISSITITDLGVEKLNNEMENINQEIALIQSKDEAKIKKLKDHEKVMETNLNKIKKELEKIHIEIN